MVPFTVVVVLVGILLRLVVRVEHLSHFSVVYAARFGIYRGVSRLVFTVTSQ